jgi:PiT family inorganic phosphate transporter
MLEIALAVLAGLYMGWNIGANNAANAVGTSIGSGLLSYKRAILIMAVFVLLGAATQGHAVMKTIGRGIIPAGQLPMEAIVIALFCAGLFVTIATYLRIPVSTSQATIGSIAGIGIAVGASINWSVIGKIVFTWVILPVIIAFLAFAICHLLAVMIRGVHDLNMRTRIFTILILATSSYMAFSLGANNAGNAFGLLTNAGFSTTILAFIGGLALASGALTYGRGVIQTIGKSITPLDPLGASSAQLATAIGVHVLSILGMPISTSQAIVGGVVGVGFVKGIRAISKRKIAHIVVGWVATPTVGGILAFLIYNFLA